MKKRALLLVNVGTPDKAEKKAVRRFLTEFLNDRRVIDIPWLFQKILVNLIIIPFRINKSTALYRRLWTKNGSPLLYFLNSIVEKLQVQVQEQYHVYGAMRYGNPSLGRVLKQINQDGMEELIILPLYPQYASSTTGSVAEKVFEEIGKCQVIPAIRIIGQFYDHPAFIKAFSSQIEKLNPQEYDHIIFSFHGLPMKHINKVHPSVAGNQCSCIYEMPAHGTLCYKATCYETTRLLIKELNLKPEKTTVSFQSRLSKNWLTPFTDNSIIQLARNGAKRILVIAPAFVADCLETIVEIEDYKTLFQNHGGQDLHLVPSLNDEDVWVQGILEIIRDNEIV